MGGAEDDVDWGGDNGDVCASYHNDAGQPGAISKAVNLTHDDIDGTGCNNTESSTSNI